MEEDPYSSVVVSEEEYKVDPSEPAEELMETVMSEQKLEEGNTTLSESVQLCAAEAFTEMQRKLEAITNENTDLKYKLETATSTITDLESQLLQTASESTKYLEAFNALEREASNFLHQRNLALDERDTCQQILDRRNTELERMRSDYASLTKQLEAAVSAKFEAIANAEKVAALQLTLEYKEKRIEQERALLNSQLESLTEDQNNRTKELLDSRRESTRRSFTLENRLAEKLQELHFARARIKTLTANNTSLVLNVEELNQKLLSKEEVAVKTQEAFQHELDAQKKLGDLYHGLAIEKTELAEKLTKGYQDLKSKLDGAIEKYGDLETKYKEAEFTHEEIVSKKNKCIALLKKELSDSNMLVENAKQESFQKEVESQSPSSSKFIKPGMSMTQMYSEYESMSEQLTSSKEECTKLQSYITTIIQELEDKSPILAKQREDYEKAIQTITEMSKYTDDLLNETQLLREAGVEAKRLEGVANCEIARLKLESQDLGRQVCYLLREVEQAHAGGPSSTTDKDVSNSASTADLISEHLVTFSDINELQFKNQRLLALVRELTAKQEEVEELDVATTEMLKGKLKILREQRADLQEQNDQQSRMVNVLLNHRDMYKNLYLQAMKSTCDEIPMQLERPYVKESVVQGHKSQRVVKVQNDGQIQELEAQVNKLRKELLECKEECDTYKQEKAVHEKLMAGQLEKVQDLMCQSTKLTARMEAKDERIKLLKNNVNLCKAQIEELEERNRIRSETIVKLETDLEHLNDEAEEAQAKLSKAEVVLGNAQKENELLRIAKSRLLQERELHKQEALSQKRLNTNVELIKAALERNGAESMARLEEQLTEAHRECAAVRRRLQEEQDRFRQLTEHLNKQTQSAQTKMEEEKRQAEKLRLELVEAHTNLVTKVAQVEDLTKELENSLDNGTDASGRIYGKVNENQEIEVLQQKLKEAKEAVEQHCNVAECAEKQLVEVAKQQEQYRKTTDTKLHEQENRIKQLQEQCSELQQELSAYDDGQEITNADINRLEKTHSQISKELHDTKSELEAAKDEIKVLQENLKSAESKYAQEMMFHSADLQAFTAVKEDLSKVASDSEAVKNERDRAKQALEDGNDGWTKQEELYKKEKNQLESRFKDLDSQNALLLNQLQELNTQISLVQAQATEPQNIFLGEPSFNKSFTEDEITSPEQLLKIIKHLRQEKDIAISKCEILEAEHVHMKSQQDVTTKQLNEAKSALEEERQKLTVYAVSEAKHAKVLRELETLNAVMDSNKTLRAERDSLVTQVNNLHNDLQLTRDDRNRLGEERNRLIEVRHVLQEDKIRKDVVINELKACLIQMKKMKKESKIQYEEQLREAEALKQIIEAKEQVEVPKECNEESRSEFEQRMTQLNQKNVGKITELHQQIKAITEENESIKNEIDNLKQTTTKKEERFKTLFKNAKERITTLTEQVASLRSELSNRESHERNADKQSCENKLQWHSVSVSPISQDPTIESVPSQQQVHTTDDAFNIEAVSSSLTKSRTEYAPVTSSDPQQVSIPPVQSSQDTEDEDKSTQVQAASQQQAAALETPKLQPLYSSKGISESSDTVTTTQSGQKRPRETDAEVCQSEEDEMMEQSKRTKLQHTPVEVLQSGTENNLELEYQVPTSSQRDHEGNADTLIMAESDKSSDGDSTSDLSDSDSEDDDMESVPYSERVDVEDPQYQRVDANEVGNEIDVIEDSGAVLKQSKVQKDPCEDVSNVELVEACHDLPNQSEIQETTDEIASNSEVIEDSSEVQNQTEIREATGEICNDVEVMEDSDEVSHQNKIQEPPDVIKDTSEVPNQSDIREAGNDIEVRGDSDEIPDQSEIPETADPIHNDVVEDSYEADKVGNDVELMEHSDEVPSQSEIREAGVQEDDNGQTLSEATSVVPSTPSLFISNESDTISETVSFPRRPSKDSFMFSVPNPIHYVAPNELVAEPLSNVAPNDIAEEQTLETTNMDDSAEAVTDFTSGSEQVEETSDECLGFPSLFSSQTLERNEELLREEDGVISESEKAEIEEEKSRKVEATSGIKSRLRSPVIRNYSSTKPRRSSRPATPIKSSRKAASEHLTPPAVRAAEISTLGSPDECSSVSAIAGSSSDDTQCLEQTEKVNKRKDRVSSNEGKSEASREKRHRSRKDKSKSSTETESRSRSRSDSSRSYSSVQTRHRQRHGDQGHLENTRNSTPMPTPMASGWAAEQNRSNEQWRYFQPHENPRDRYYATPRGRGQQAGYLPRVPRRGRGRSRKSYGSRRNRF